jgi:hypothetical protein
MVSTFSGEDQVVTYHKIKLLKIEDKEGRNKISIHELLELFLLPTSFHAHEG